jgi:hypothetical protein
MHVGFEVLTAVAMNAAIFWDIAPCSPYVERRFRGTYHLHLQGKELAEQGTSLQQAIKAYTASYPRRCQRIGNSERFCQSNLKLLAKTNILEFVI